jgi:LysM repeat protein
MNEAATAAGPGAQDMGTIRVAKGDTLSKLVSRHNRGPGRNVTLAQICKLNRIKDPNRILAGMKLVFPDGFDRPRSKPAPKKESPKPTPVTLSEVKLGHVPGKLQRTNPLTESLDRIMKQPTLDIFSLEKPRIIR